MESNKINRKQELYNIFLSGINKKMNKDSFMKPSVSSATNSHTQWKFKAKLSHCQIWQNYQDSSIAEAYLLPASYMMKQEKNYSLRKGSKIVQSLGFLYLNSFSMKNKNAYVLIQRIPNRLSQVNALTQSQCLKVLYSTYRSLESIEKVWGQFQLTEDCICFNTKGEIKVWINPDLWCNYPEKPFCKSHNSFKLRDNELIWKVFQMVEKRSINPIILEPFRRQRQKISSFFSAYNFILNVAQNLFLDIGIYEEKTHENNVLKIQLKNEGNECEYYETKLNSQRIRKSSLRSKENKYLNTFPNKKTGNIERIKTEWSNYQWRNSQVRDGRSRDFSGYQTLKGNQSQFQLQNEQKKIKKYQSVPSSPREFTHAFKKKNKDYSDKSASHPTFQRSQYRNLQESIHQEIKEENIPKQSNKDFQTFGLLEGEREEEKVENSSDFIEKKCEGKRSSLFDVATMEQELMKFDQRRKKQKQNSSNKQRLSLEEKENEINNSSFSKEGFAATVGAPSSFHYDSKSFNKERKQAFSFNYPVKNSQQSTGKRQLDNIKEKVEKNDQKTRHERHISQLGIKDIIHNRTERTSKEKYNIYHQAEKQQGQERLTLPKNHKRQTNVIL